MQAAVRSSKRSAGKSRRIDTRTQEAECLRTLGEAPEGSPLQRTTEARLASLVSNVVVLAARRVAARTGADVQELVQEGTLATFGCWRTYRQKPGAPCLYAAFVRTVAYRSMMRFALEATSPVHVSDWERKRAARAKRQAAATGGPSPRAPQLAGFSPEMLDEWVERKARRDVHRPRASTPPNRYVDAADILVEPSAGADTLMLDMETLEQLRAALGHLTQAQRHVVLASCGFGTADGRAPADRSIAQQMRLHPDAVNTLRQDALRRLRLLLEECECP